MAGYLGNAPTAVPLTSADITDGIITSAKIADSTIALADLSATGTKDATTFLRGDNSFATVVSGLSEADQWRITANVTITAGGITDLTANWERNDSTGFGHIGTGMTQSSGIFTFPSTGYYYIQFTSTMESTGGNRYFGGSIMTTTNNSTYGARILPFESGYENGATATTTGSFIFDVTSTANCKVKFGTYNSAMTNVITYGDTSYNYTYATFIRLGDT